MQAEASGDAHSQEWLCHCKVTHYPKVRTLARAARDAASSNVIRGLKGVGCDVCTPE